MNERTIQDCRPFYIYLFLMYQDGLNQRKYLGDKSFVTGAYILPIGINQCCRISWVAACVFNISVDVQATNDLRTLILEYNVMGVMKLWTL